MALNKSTKKEPISYSVEVSPAKEGEGGVRRNPISKDKLTETFDENFHTIYEVFETTLKTMSERNFLGMRKPLENKKWGPYEWESFGTIGQRRTHFGSGLVNVCGMQTGEPLGIYAMNRSEWVITDLAAHAYNFRTVALYDTLGKDAVEYVVNHADVKVVVVAGKQLDIFLASSENCKSLQFIVTMDKPSEEQVKKAESHNIKLVQFSELEESGKKDPKPHSPPKPEDLITIMYTSGTTGNPKGVMLTHKNLMAVLAGVRNLLKGEYAIGKEDRHLSYLPLAHSFERVNMYSLTAFGGACGFYHGVIPELIDDITTLKPTIMLGAPRVWSRLKTRVEANVQGASWLKRTMFEMGYNSKKDAIHSDKSTPLLDKVVFAKTKAALGGCVRWILSGSAPLDPQLGEFLKIVFCCNVLEGYGLTENMAGAFATNPRETKFGSVGGPLSGMEAKLVDVADMNYSSKNTPPTGEICLRGPCIFSGYYKDEKTTKEAIDSDGWFHTGDIGRWNDDGSLSIIDRKKNIFKLSQGEYVAVEYLEQVYNRASYVNQVWVYGKSTERFVVAVAVPDFDMLIPPLKSAGITETDHAKLASMDKVKEMIFADLTATAKTAKLHGFEFVKDIIVSHEPFTVENGLTTPTFKLIRNKLQNKFQKEIDEMYAKLSKLEEK